MRMPLPWPLTDIDEPDRRLDHLLALLHKENDPALDRWAVDALAGERGLSVHLLDDDPLVEAQSLAEALLTAWAVAGQDRHQRGQVLAVITDLIQELHEQVDVWRGERQERRLRAVPG